jgi:hypothetical protein
VLQCSVHCELAIRAYVYSPGGRCFFSLLAFGLVLGFCNLCAALFPLSTVWNKLSATHARSAFPNCPNKRERDIPYKVGHKLRILHVAEYDCSVSMLVTCASRVKVLHFWVH